MIKNFDEFITEKVSVKNGLINNPDKSTKEIAEFNKVLPELIESLPKKDDMSYFINFTCYNYEEHVIAYVGVDKDKKKTILAEVELEDLKDTDKLVEKIKEELEKL